MINRRNERGIKRVKKAKKRIKPLRKVFKGKRVTAGTFFVEIGGLDVSIFLMETRLVDIARPDFRLPVLAWPFGTVLGPLQRSPQRPRYAGQCFESL